MIFRELFILSIAFWIHLPRYSRLTCRKSPNHLLQEAAQIQLYHTAEVNPDQDDTSQQFQLLYIVMASKNFIQEQDGV